MSYGLKIFNGFSQAIIDDTLVSMIKKSSGTATPTHQSGDTMKAYDAPGKGASKFNSSMPYSDEMWGGTRKTLYFYPMNPTIFPNIANGPMFTQMNVGDEQTYGRPSRRNGNGSPRNDQIFPNTGIISTRSTLPWAVLDQRDIDVAPTGYGMAIFGADGKCRWSVNDELAWTPYIKNGFSTHVSSVINETYGGWIFTISPGYFAFDGVGSTRIFGRFVRTAAGQLDYIVDPYYAVNYPGYPGAPTPNVLTTWQPPLMLGQMG